MDFYVTELDRTPAELPEGTRAHLGWVGSRKAAETNARLAVANGAHETPLFVAVAADFEVVARFASADHPMAKHADYVYVDGRWMVAE